MEMPGAGAGAYRYAFQLHAAQLPGGHLAPTASSCCPSPAVQLAGSAAASRPGLGSPTHQLVTISVLDTCSLILGPSQLLRDGRVGERNVVVGRIPGVGLLRHAAVRLDSLVGKHGRNDCRTRHGTCYAGVACVGVVGMRMGGFGRRCEQAGGQAPEELSRLLVIAMAASPPTPCPACLSWGSCPSCRSSVYHSHSNRIFR